MHTKNAENRSRESSQKIMMQFIFDQCLPSHLFISERIKKLYHTQLRAT